MRRHLRACLFLASIGIISCQFSFPFEDGPLSFNEAEMRAALDEGGMNFEVPVLNRSVSNRDVTLKLDLLDPHDNVMSAGQTKAQLHPGRNLVTLRLAKPEANRATHKDVVLWCRLRYRLISGTESEPSVQGLVSIGAIAKDLFDIRIVHLRFGMEGQVYRVHVHAANPVTRQPVAGVEVKGVLSFDAESDNGAMTFTRTTDSAGDALLSYRIPKTVEDREGELKIEARKGTLVREDEFDVELPPLTKVILNTDKSLYQPAQSLHARAAIFDWSDHALAQTVVRFTLRDPEESILFRENATTNEFGIANVDWQLPDSLRFGDYALSLEMPESDRYENALGLTTVRVSRYELPNFTATAKLDRPYYLPDQNAQADVSATYLFGKPVTHGSIRLVRETERRWNYREQKWESEEHEEQTAVLDASGHARFQLDLASLHTDFRDETYQRFRDVKYAAFATDSTTGRTEQRRFKLRLSREPIHIYLSGAESDGEFADFYVTTYYADGAPASCQVQISQALESWNGVSAERTRVLRSIRTNRYGAAKVTGLKLLRDGKHKEMTLLLEARDKAQAYGRYKDNLWVSARRIAVSTDKALYAEGDPVIVSVRAPELSGNIIVDLAGQGAVLASSRIHLRRGRGFTTFRYQPQFRETLAVLAYSLDSSTEDYSNTPMGSHTIMFPRNTDLRVKIRPDHQTYRPGEELNVRLLVSSPSGALEAKALGVTVVDKAVEERARTDQEFGSGHYGFWDWGWWYDLTAIGGVSEEDLKKVDLARQLPDGLDLAAEILLNSRGTPYYATVEESDYESQTEALFSDRIKAQLSGLRAALHNESLPGWKFPANNKELSELCKKAGVHLDGLTDPWGTPYKFEFDVQWRDRFVRVRSPGPDKKIDTVDDIRAANEAWSYFSPVGAVIDRAVKETHARSGAYIRDLKSLQTEVLRQGVDLETLRDPWGQRYRFDFKISNSFYQVNVYTHEPSESATDKPYDFMVWTSNIDYFNKPSKQIDSALAAYGRRTGRFPRNDQEFDQATREAGFDFRSLLDPWGNPYAVTYVRSARYADAETITYNPQAAQQNTSPVTRKLDWVNIWSNGPDGKPGTVDDVALAGFSRIISEQSGTDIVPQPVVSVPLAESTGAIDGTVLDPSGAVIPGAKITAKREDESNEEYSTETSSPGTYLLRNMKPGRYSVEFVSPGFLHLTVKDIPVHASSVTTVNVTLQLGGVTQTVTVQAQAVQVSTESSSMVSERKAQRPGTAQVQEQTVTPRLRDYFPETLYWEPSLITDRTGQAKLKFKLADNITTWKMSVLASTKDGQIGAADAEITAFQPFFADHDPPKILTVGDEIDLPVVVRNYLKQVQQVGVEMRPADWFSMKRPGKQQISVPAGDSAVAVFPFRALTAVKSGKQTIVAANRTVGDAIEKPVYVHPDGREESAAVTEILRGGGTLNLQLPRDIIAGSLHSEIKIYPNLMAHVEESIEGSLHRPYGCGEQMISSTYPSVLLLKHYKQSHVTNKASAQRAERYLRLGYNRLLNYRDESGGFTYWGNGKPDIALTAYAVRFLLDASELIDVDEDTISGAVNWLVSQQQKDGNWVPGYGSGKALTAYVTRILARAQNQLPDVKPKTQAQEAVKRGLQYFAASRELVQDPYNEALHALAAWDAGNRDEAVATAVKLRSLAHQEGKGTYWALDTNTPFYGWGTAGRIESTAVAISALAEIDGQSNDSAQLIASGITFLLKQKDCYGVWYSGQATVNVLEALLGVLRGSRSDEGGKATVSINGQPAATFDLPPASVASGPLFADISKFTRPGDNSIEIHVDGSAAHASAQVVADYFVAWDQGGEVRELTRTGQSRALRLAVSFDRTEVRVGEEVSCTIDAERIGHYGYGMLLAEVGVAPGAEIDRASLDSVIKNSGWSLSRYDVQPDRLILYLWPSAGGSKFTFSFRPRFALKARTAPSLLYDYYNPDERLVLPPADFHILPRLDGVQPRRVEASTGD